MKMINSSSSSSSSSKRLQKQRQQATSIVKCSPTNTTWIWFVFTIGLMFGSSFSIVLFYTSMFSKEYVAVGIIPSTAAAAITTTTTTTTTTTDDDDDESMLKSLNKLHEQLLPGQLERFKHNLNKTKAKIYIDLGLSDGKDTGHHLSNRWSTISVDAYKPWIDAAKNKFQTEIQTDRALFFNVGVGLHDSNTSLPLYFKQEGSVIASFVKEKGCQGAVYNTRICKHIDIPVVRCDVFLQLINEYQVELMKIDIEMLHHSCIRRLTSVAAAKTTATKTGTVLLPKHVCWEEHDKPFGHGGGNHNNKKADILRPITDVKLILLMYELGYDFIKIVMQGPQAPSFYNLKKEQAGFGQGSGTLSTEEMMHYRSYEDHFPPPPPSVTNTNDTTTTTAATTEFDTEWKAVHKVLQQGVFGIGQPPKPRHYFEGKTYYDICMKLSSPNHIAERNRIIRSTEESFSLSSIAALL